MGSATSGRAVSRSAAGQRPAPRRPRRHDLGGRAQGLAGGQRSPGQEASSRSRASLRIPLSSLRLGGQAGAAAPGLGIRGLTQGAAGQETSAQWLGVLSGACRLGTLSTWRLVGRSRRVPASSRDHRRLGLRLTDATRRRGRSVTCSWAPARGGASSIRCGTILSGRSRDGRVVDIPHA